MEKPSLTLRCLFRTSNTPTGAPVGPLTGAARMLRVKNPVAASTLALKRGSEYASVTWATLL